MVLILSIPLMCYCIIFISAPSNLHFFINIDSLLNNKEFICLIKDNHAQYKIQEIESCKNIYHMKYQLIKNNLFSKIMCMVPCVPFFKLNVQWRNKPPSLLIISCSTMCFLQAHNVLLRVRLKTCNRDRNPLQKTATSSSRSAFSIIFILFIFLVQFIE